VSAWNLAVGWLILARRPSSASANLAGFSIAGLQTALLARRLRQSSVDPALAPIVVGKNSAAEGRAVGHLLRREWWPLGWLALASTPRSRLGRFAAAAMLIPIAGEWFTRRTAMDLPRYVALRLLEDAAYGSGVIIGALRRGRPGVLLPLVRLPGRGRTGSSNRPMD
jgi:hypothetical protein